jgi:hypothetical protein
LRKKRSQKKVQHSSPLFPKRTIIFVLFQKPNLLLEEKKKKEIVVGSLFFSTFLNFYQHFKGIFRQLRKKECKVKVFLWFIA